MDIFNLSDSFKNTLRSLYPGPFYLYEIVGKKVGVTQDLNRRQKEQKNKGSLVILGEYTDIILVSEKEQETQALKGYHIDKHPYWYTIHIQNPKSCTPEAIAKQVANNDPIKASEATRKLTKRQVINMRKKYSEDITISAHTLAKKYKVSVQTIIDALNGNKYSDVPNPVEIRDARVKCKYCDAVSTVTNIGRWHNEKCNKAPNPIKRKGKLKTKYKELITGEIKYLSEFAEYYKVDTASIISNSKFPKPGKCGPLKGLSFIKL